MQLRPTRYNYVPGPAQSVGCASLELPFMNLWRQVEYRFLCETAEALCSWSSNVDVDEWMDTHELGRGALALEPWFAHLTDAPDIQWNGGAAELRRIANLAEDLADDEGSWRTWLEDMLDASKAATAEIRERLQQSVEQTLVQSGPRTALALLEQTRQRLNENLIHLQDERESWTGDRAVELRSMASELRRYAVPTAGHWKLWVKFHPSAPARRWLTERQLAAVHRSLDVIRTAAAIRFCELRRRAQVTVLQALVGRNGNPGMLESLRQRVRSSETIYRDIIRGIPAPNLLRPSSSCSLLVVSDIDTVLDDQSRLTLADVYVERILDAGCDPQMLADRLWSEGLCIDGRTFSPGEWSNCDLAGLREAFLLAGRRYLGADDPSRPINVNEPKSAFDHAATVTLTYPALRDLVERHIGEWVRRSAPYDVYPTVCGNTPSVNRYLFCYAPDRRDWERLVATHVRPATVESEDFSVRHPYTAILMQLGFGYPAHANPCFIRSVHQNRVRQATGSVRQLFADRQFAELRLLTKRPHDHREARHLFNALKKTRAIREIKNSLPRFAVSTSDPTVERFFTTTVSVPEWRPASDWRRALEKAQFQHFVEMHRPDIADWGEVALRLAHHPSPEYVARKLASLHVLEADQDGLYRIAFKPDRGGNIPAGLYSNRRGQLIGLTESQFVATLLADDFFYNAMFWRLMDAVADGRLLQSDLSPFARHYLESVLA